MRWREVLLTILVLMLLVAMGSYARALVYPGRASLSVRTVGWIRDHGGGSVVDAVENWWYTAHAPPTDAPDPTLAPPAPGMPGPMPGAPAPLPRIGPRLAPGEGSWTPGPTMVRGVPAMWASFVRPDPEHPGVVAGVARFNQSLVKARLIAGTKEPNQQLWPEGGQVPPDQRAGLVATFNSGFKMADAQGGFYADGRMAVPLRDGAASLVLDRAGRVSVDMWGRDRHFGPGIAAVRQNLALIVDNGALVPGLDGNRGNRWGSARNQFQYTWRSAAGVDAAGNLFYVAGNGLTLVSLARALADTGVVRGMELDIHPNMVHLFAYQQSDGASDPRPTALLAQMRQPWDRYLSPDQRDFVAVTLR